MNKNTTLRILTREWKQRQNYRQRRRRTRAV